MIFLEWVRRIWYLVNRQRLERELQQEMDAHREMMQERARFGNTLRLREESRDVWGVNWLDGLSRDIRYSVRMLRRYPMFSVLAIFTVGLGIGAFTATFSVVDHVLLRPLPYKNSDRLVNI